MINQARREYVVNCPVCDEWVFTSRIRPDVPQRFKTRVCKNKHEFVVDIGYISCTTMTLESL